MNLPNRQGYIVPLLPFNLNLLTPLHIFTSVNSFARFPMNSCRFEYLIIISTKHFLKMGVSVLARYSRF